ncbi:MAG TPA: cellulase family glycosylhydrolase [Terracidiphilus sp.]
MQSRTRVQFGAIGAIFVAGVLLSTAITRTAQCLVTTTSAANVGLNPSQFQGVNWARLSDPGSPSDNFHNGPLILQGLRSPDFSGAHYASIRAQADAILAGFQSSLGANTIRIPVNPETVLSPWWNSYRGIIDAATARGMNVDLSYWAEDEVGKGNVVSNLALWNQMWTTIIGDYHANRRVYFNPFQEPIGYGGLSWLNVAANWLQIHNKVPRNRVLMPGISYQTDVTPLCKDHRFDGTYLALHVYAFPSSPKSYGQWVKEIKSGIGSCASRTVVEEFGGPMDTDVNYDDPNPAHSPKLPGIDYKNGNYSTVANLPYMRAITDAIHDNNLGAIEWDALGGRNYDGGHEPFSLLQLNPKTANGLPLWIPNASGVDRLRYAWHMTTVRRVPPPDDVSKPRRG